MTDQSLDLVEMARAVNATDKVREGWAAWADGRRDDVPDEEVQKAIEAYITAHIIINMPGEADEAEC